jgi:lipoate-protein ligase A
MQIWRLIDRGPESPEVNMAIDEAIALSGREGSSPPTLRLYQWSRPTISLGYFQKAQDTLNLDFCSEKGIGIIRRLTGGRAVYHEQELTYSMAASNGTELFGKNLKETFLKIGEGFQKGLEKLGVNISLWEEPVIEGRRSPLCFSSSSWYELSVQGKKLMGSAQRRWSNGFLQHGSLLFQDDPTIYSTFFRFSSEQNRAKILSDYQNKAIPLKQILSPLPSLKKLKDSICSGFEEAFSIRFQQEDLLPHEKDLVPKLIQERYGNNEWNLR